MRIQAVFIAFPGKFVRRNKPAKGWLTGGPYAGQAGSAVIPARH
jgi:hypothetical protein